MIELGFLENDSFKRNRLFWAFSNLKSPKGRILAKVLFAEIQAKFLPGIETESEYFRLIFFMTIMFQPENPEYISDAVQQIRPEK